MLTNNLWFFVANSYWIHKDITENLMNLQKEQSKSLTWKIQCNVKQRNKQNKLTEIKSRN